MYVLTGINGHVGGNLARQLLEKGDKVRGVVHRNTKAIDGLNVEQVQGSVHDQASLRKAFDGAHTVVHLAAKISITGDKDGSVHRTNVLGARHAARAALEAGVKKFVHVSSIHAYDLHAPGPVRERSRRAKEHNAAYDQSKYNGEKEVRKVANKGLHATIVNPTGVIGPHDFGPSRMGKVFLDLARKRLPALVRGGFDFVDVRDVSLAIQAAAKKGAKGENYLLGGHFVQVPELAKIAESVTGVPAPKRNMSPDLAMAGVPFAKLLARGAEPSFTRESIDALRHGKEVDIGKARKALKHNPRPLDETVRDIYADFATRGILAI